MEDIQTHMRHPISSYTLPLQLQSAKQFCEISVILNKVIQPS